MDILKDVEKYNRELDLLTSWQLESGNRKVLHLARGPKYSYTVDFVSYEFASTYGNVKEIGKTYYYYYYKNIKLLEIKYYTYVKDATGKVKYIKPNWLSYFDSKATGIIETLDSNTVFNLSIIHNQQSDINIIPEYSKKVWSFSKQHWVNRSAHEDTKITFNKLPKDVTLDIVKWWSSVCWYNDRLLPF